MGWIFISLRTAESWHEWYARDVLFIFISLLLFLLTVLCGRFSASLVYDLSSSKDAMVFCSLLSAHLKEFNHREMRCSGGYFYTLDDVQVIAIDSSTKITRLPWIHDDYCWLQAITSFSILLLKLQLTYDNSKVQTIFVNHKMLKSLFLWAQRLKHLCSFLHVAREMLEALTL